MYNDELQHYGVIGMKSGVRRDPAKAYARAIRERDKLTAQSSKLLDRGARLNAKSHGVSGYVKSKIPGVRSINAVNRERGANLSKNGLKLKRRARRLNKAIDKTFKDYTIERIPKGNIDAGKSYMYRLIYGDDSYTVTKRS